MAMDALGHRSLAARLQTTLLKAVTPENISPHVVVVVAAAVLVANASPPDALSVNALSIVVTGVQTLRFGTGLDWLHLAITKVQLVSQPFLNVIHVVACAGAR
jgi:hypothetical protein